MKWYGEQKTLTGILDAGGIGWKNWIAGSHQSINRRLFGAVMTIGGLTVIVKLAAAGKDVLVAYQFGLGDDLDAFIIAFLLPQFVVNLIGGSLNAALIPTYMHVRDHEGPEAAQSLLSSVVFSSSALLIVAGLILASTATYLLPLLALGFSEEKLRVTMNLYYLLLPMLLFSGLTTTWGAILNTSDRFALAAFVPLITSLVTVVAIVMLAKHWGVYALAGGIVFGMALEAIVLTIALMNDGVRPMPSWQGVSPGLRQVFHQLVPMMAGMFLMGSAGLISQSMAAMLGSGSVAAFNYGVKITTLVLSVGSVAVSTAILPHFSRMVAGCEWEGVRQTLITSVRYIAFVAVPLTLLLIYFSEPLIRLCFQRGAFTDQDAKLVGQVQALFAVQIPFYAMGIVAVRLLSALKANQVAMWGTVINLIVSVMLNYLLMQWFGVAGLALSVSLMYLVSMTYLLIMAWRLLCQTQSAGAAAPQMASSS